MIQKNGIKKDPNTRSKKQPRSQSVGLSPRPKRSKPKARSTRTSKDHNFISLDDIFRKRNKHQARPTDLKEKDQVLAAFQEHQPEEVDQLLKDDRDAEREATPVDPGKKIDTEDGHITVKTIGLKK